MLAAVANVNMQLLKQMKRAKKSEILKLPNFSGF